MSSNTSTTEHSTSAKAETTATPRIPQDVIEEILDHLAAGSDFRSLRACALVSKSWVQPCRRHLFRTVIFTSRGVGKWFKTFPVPEESPAHHVRDFGFWIIGSDCVPEQFLEHVPYFPNVEAVSLIGTGERPMLPPPPFWTFPQSVTSLTIDTNVVTLVQVRDIIARLPNLDDLSLSGSFIPVGREASRGIGTALGGRFGGRLQLRGGCTGKDVIDMLLDIPSGLRFTKLEIYCMRQRLLPAVRLVEACGKALVKLSYVVSFSDASETFERSFDFSKLPNLREANFGFRVGSADGGLSWIPMALSTLKPTTSPRLSTIRLDFICTPISRRAVETVIKDAGEDLRLIAGEVARIEHEFKGAVNFTIVRSSEFKAVLDTLNIFRNHGR